VLNSPGFNQNDFERTRDSQLAAIKAASDSPTSLMFRELHPFLFEGSSYGFYHLGTPEGLSGFTIEDAQRIWDKQSTQPWTLAVCGQFDRDLILQFAQNLPVPTVSAKMPTAPEWGTARELDLRLPGRNQTHILLLFKTVPDNHPDAPGLELLQTALSGMSGPLFLRLREQQGLAYSVSAMNWASPLTGFIAFYIGTSPDKETQALKGFYKIIDELHETPLPQADLYRAGNQMEGSYFRGTQTLSSRSAEAASLNALGRPLTFAADNIAAAKSLTPEDLQKLATTYLSPDTAYLIRIDPAESQ
jgi:zinc protease